MRQNTRILVALLVAGILSAVPLAQAQPLPPGSETYSETVSRKLSSGAANLATSSLEVPKSMVIITNQSNVIYGVAGGLIQGILNTLGRSASGMLDILTAPFPTQPFVYPLYVWDDFDAQTVYGPILRPEENSKP